MLMPDSTTGTEEEKLVDTDSSEEQASNKRLEKPNRKILEILTSIVGSFSAIAEYSLASYMDGSFVLGLAKTMTGKNSLGPHFGDTAQ